MEQRPNLIYVLIILWTIIGILFLGLLITYTTNYLDQLNSKGSLSFSNSKFDTMMNFSLVLYILLFLFIVIFSFLLAYGTFIKKSWSWLLGIMISSFSGFFAYLGIQSLGNLIIMDNFSQMFANAYSTFQYVTFFMMIFFVPILLIILTRPGVKAYFGKT